MKNKYQRCTNCLHEGGRHDAKCAKGTVKAHMREGGRFCIDHAFRPGWEMEGTIFEGTQDGDQHNPPR